ncbi:MAG: acetate--CoA ligase family protein [Patescibacteria group bacterium]
MDIEKLVNPKSIALIGASGHPEKVGFQILKNIVDAGYTGRIYPVNPKGGQILDLDVKTDLLNIEENIDLAIIVIPSAAVLDEVRKCALKKVKSVIVISAGFGEIGEEGEKLQAELVEICKDAGILLLGPNCLGLINTQNNLNASFAREMPVKGNVSFMSQSGAIISALNNWSLGGELGFSKIFSLGNKALLREAELLQYLYEDADTKVIIAYFESLDVDSRLTEVLQKYAKKKPTIVLFGGKSDFGAEAAASHTGSIVSSYLSIKTYLTQSGVLLAETLEDLLLLARFFSSYQTVNGKNIAVVTNAGGPAIATSDAISRYNLSLARLSEETMAKLRAELKAEANVKNPVDLLGDANEEAYRKAIDIVSADSGVDGIIVLLTPQTTTKILETANVLADYNKKKPLAASFIGGKSLTDATAIIEKKGIPCFGYPEDAIRCFQALFDFSKKPAVAVSYESHKKEYIENEKISILGSYNLPVLQYFTSANAEDLRSMANEIGYPVVLKTANPEIIHKSDAGGIVLDIKSDAALEEAYKKIGPRVSLGKMIKGKHEIFLGAKNDEKVGVVLAFGTGGIYAEIYGDFSYRIAPLSEEDAKEMIMESKMGAVLNGARGQEVYDLDRLAKIIVDTGKLMLDYTNIKEIDFNPIIADEQNFYIVDARIIEK